MLVTSGTDINYENSIIGTWAFSGWNDFFGHSDIDDTEYSIINTDLLTRSVSYSEKIIKSSVK